MLNKSPKEHCFHCGQPIAAGVQIMARLAEPAPVCCVGCAAVAELIAGVGLSDYYRFRDQPGNKPEQAAAHHATSARWRSYAQAHIVPAFVQQTDGICQATVLIADLRCAACAWLIEHHLSSQPGMVSIKVSLTTQRALIRWQPERLGFDQVLAQMAALGYDLQPLTLTHADQTLQAHQQQQKRSAQKRLGLAALGMMQVMMYVLPLYTRNQTAMDDSVAALLSWVSWAITTPVLLYSGWPFLRSAWQALTHRHINMDVPVALALVLAYVASVANVLRDVGTTYFDSITMFIFLLTLGRYVEMSVRHRAGSFTDACARLQPEVAHRVATSAPTTTHREPNIQDVLIGQLQVGDELLVRSGETIAADGVVLSGHSRVNEALLTGESMPVVRAFGDRVLAGSVNTTAPLRMRVTALGEHTLLSGMVRLLEQAQFVKPHMTRLADRIARHLLLALLGLTLGVAIAWWFIDAARMFDVVLAVLVVTCPCALSLAAPTAVAAAMQALARQGLLITRADAIERLAQVQAVWFDKTGTLTTGRMTLQRVEVSAAITTEQALAMAVALEAGAQHPIAEALRRATTSGVHYTASELRVIPGQGVQGVLDGQTYRLGTPRFVNALTDTQTRADRDDIVLGNAHGQLAWFSVRDTLRADAMSAVTQLREQQMSLALYSGDAPATVSAVARALGLTDWHARQTPQDKLHAMQARGVRVAMVGDGVNDAPVLAAAHVAIAMGQGAALAQVSADAVLVSGRLQTLPAAIALAQRAQRILRQNLWWAGAYNLSVVPLAAMGWVTPWLAALGMSCSSLLVTLNAARLLRDADTTRMQPSSEPQLDAAPLTRPLTRRIA